MRALIRQSIIAGAITGALTGAAAVVIFVLFDALALLWPFVFIPVFATGAYALSRARGAVHGSSGAVLTGATAGLVAAVVADVPFLITALMGQKDTLGPDPTPYWTLQAVLQAPPFSVPRDVLFVDLPFAVPDWWGYARQVPGGAPVPQLPLTLLWFVPLGAALAATQSWIAYALEDRVRLPERLVSRIARARSTFDSKLRFGFLLLTVLLFVVGWLGFASTEEMHSRLHQPRAFEHFRDHVASLQTNVAAQASAIAKLGPAPDAAALQQVSAAGQRVTTEITHMKTLPPPRHPGNISVGRQNLTGAAEVSLPLVTETEVAYRQASAAAAKLLDAYRAGRTADAQSAIADFTQARAAVDKSLAQFDVELQKAIRTSLDGADSETHAQLILMLVLITTATAVAFPLGYVFSQVVVRPVTAVDAGLERIGKGEFAQRIQVENRDELGELAAHVNAMGTELERLYGELRGLNEGLQQQVQDHVREIERSRMLRRYLPQQVADAVIASGDESLLQTHRREITVVFGDLRGFTAFSETGEPEVVMGVLREYHGAVGELISRYSGTLEHFAGDGWMVYFNDPLPVPEHPAQAVRMAVAMRDRVGELARGWRRLGFELDFGVGIAIGYATLGEIGFEGRHDYGAVGAVSNLAARLSDEAKGGQILVSQRVHALVEELVEAEPAGEVRLKGFLKPVVAFNIVALRSAPAAAPA